MALPTPQNPSIARDNLDNAFTDYAAAREEVGRTVAAASKAVSLYTALASNYSAVLAYIDGLPANTFNDQLKADKAQVVADFQASKAEAEAIETAIQAVLSP